MPAPVSPPTPAPIRAPTRGSPPTAAPTSAPARAPPPVPISAPPGVLESCDWPVYGSVVVQAVSASVAASATKIFDFIEYPPEGFGLVAGRCPLNTAGRR